MSQPIVLSVCIQTQRNRVRPPPTSGCVQIAPMMKNPYRCVLLYTLSACSQTVRHMTEPATTRGQLTAFLITCTSTSRVKKNPSSSPHPPSPPLPPGATETGIQTHSTSFLSSHLLIPHRHPHDAVRARARYRRHSSWHVFLYRPSRLARASQTTRQSSNDLARAIAGRQARGKHVQETILARMS